jgi:hypothetical protein
VALVADYDQTGHYLFAHVQDLFRRAPHPQVGLCYLATPLYSIATAIGGISGPVLLGNIIGTGNAGSLFVAYLVGAGFMIFAAVIEVVLGVRAEGESLENVATPLTAIEETTGKSAASSAT